MVICPSIDYSVIFNAKVFGTFDKLDDAIQLAKKMIMRRPINSIGSIVFCSTECVGIVTDDANGVAYHKLTKNG